MSAVPPIPPTVDWAEDLLGEFVVKNDGTKIFSKALQTKDVVGIYFSAHWCPPCRGFTPKLATVYDELVGSGKSFEIVFVSSDSDEDSWHEYHSEMPWLSMPFEDRDSKDAASNKYGVSGIPTLVLLDGKTGKIISKNARSLITDVGPLGFPYTEAAVENARNEIAAARVEAASQFKYLKNMKIVGHDGSHVTIPEDANESDIIILAFGNSDNRGWQAVGSALKNVVDALPEDEKPLVVVIPWENEDGDDEDASKSFGFARAINITPELCESVTDLLGDVDVPTITVMNGTASSVLVEDAARSCYNDGVRSYPWTPEAKAACAARKEGLQASITSKCDGLEFLDMVSDKLVKNGAPISAKDIQSADVVGIYFSAHWCGPCRNFTPAFADVYKELTDAGKRFEVVFSSLDSDASSFAEYFSEMPWAGISFDGTEDFREALWDVIGAQGIPHLVLYDTKSKTFQDYGCKAVRLGAEYFPWDKASIARGESEFEAKQAASKAAAVADENAVVETMKSAGLPVFTRIRGLPGKNEVMVVDGKYAASFSGFNTVGAKSCTFSSGKVMYEIEVNTREDIFQVGWASPDFSEGDEVTGEGVGDDAVSWGFDGIRVCKWNMGNPTEWGQSTPEGSILGVAADLDAGTIEFGFNGEWSVAFTDVSGPLFPAITGTGGILVVNFGATGFRFPRSGFEAPQEASKAPSVPASSSASEKDASADPFAADVAACVSYYSEKEGAEYHVTKVRKTKRMPDGSAVIGLVMCAGDICSMGTFNVSPTGEVTDA